jgi:hypothetical protein
MSTAKQQKQQRHNQIAWRRSQVLELASKGYSQSHIARVLQVDKSVICRDITALNQQSKENIKKYVDEKLPNEYEKCLVGLTAILRESWDMAQQPDIDRREKIQALALAKECYTTKLELLTNANVVDDAIKFVAGHSVQEKKKRKEITNEDIQKEAASIIEESTSNQIF